MANGGIIGKVNNPTSTTATGVWQQEEQYEAVRDGTWPSRALFTTKSARFNDGSSDYLNKTASAGNRRTFTFSTWLKLSQLTTGRYLFTSWSANNDAGFTYLAITDGNKIKFAGYGTTYLETTQLFRDPSAWYHLVLAVDTTSGTANNRCRIYLNGSEITSFGTRNNPSQNADLAYNQNSVDLVLGSNNYGGSKGNYFDGYLAEFIAVDGQQLAPTSFGVANSDGVWTPIPYSGTFGTNGFNLQFENAAALGTDSSSNGNTFTVNNLTSIDQSTDYPENNFATFNPLDVQASTQTLAEGNLKVTTDSGGDWDTMASTIGVTSGKWYFEAKLITLGSNAIIGVIDINDARLNTTTAYYIGQSTPGCGYQNSGARPDTGASFGNSYTANDIIGVAIDMDNLKVYFSKNGTFQNSGNPTSGATGTGAQDLTASTTYSFAISGYASTVWEANFGSPSYAISSGNADGNGYGNFEYAVPSGYYSLNTKNLGEFG